MLSPPQNKASVSIQAGERGLEGKSSSRSKKGSVKSSEPWEQPREGLGQGWPPADRSTSTAGAA